VLGKQVIIDFLVRHTIHDIFYLPGIHTLSLNEGLSVKNINVFVPRHESTMAFMADGFARVSGKIGVLIVTPGPGLGNVVTGCMEAYGDDIPLLVIHIDTGREEIGKGILHELVEPENMFRYVTKETFSVQGREDLVSKLDMAYNVALSERRGPVLISIPYTLLEKEVPSQGSSESNPIPAHQFNGLAGFEKVLAQKKRPIIIGGKSLMFEQARPLLDEICMSSSIPFLTTTSGKGILDEENPWCFGNIMQKGIAKEIVSSADITIAIGTRLRDVDAKRRGVKIRDLAHIDIDNAWFNKNYPASYMVSGEILPFLHDLKNAVQGRTFDWPLKKLKEAQYQERQKVHDISLGFQLMSLVKDSIPDNTTTVWDLNLMAYWAEYYYPVRHQHSFIMPRGISSIFYALPAAIGAKLGRREQPCLAVCGDGGILPTIGELSTIRKHNIPVVILVFNNNSFGILEDYMRATYSIEGIMSLENPDFVRLASAFGIKAKRAKTLRQLKNIFSNYVRWDEPFLVEFSGPVFAPPWRT
jgi:acetolactate synthase I/II/III large subunit